MYKIDLDSAKLLGSNLMLTPISFPSKFSAGGALISVVSKMKSVRTALALGSRFLAAPTFSILQK